MNDQMQEVERLLKIIIDSAPHAFDGDPDFQKDVMDASEKLRHHVRKMAKDAKRLRNLFIRAAVFAESHYDPGPIPASEPTDADMEISDIIYWREKELKIDAAREEAKHV